MSIQTRLSAKLARCKGGATPQVAVSYNTPYAVYVHEDMEAVHLVGEARFLANAVRAGRPLWRKQAATALQENVPLKTVLLAIGKEAKRDSQERCPVDSGELRASARVEVAQ